MRERTRRIGLRAVEVLALILDYLGRFSERSARLGLAKLVLARLRAERHLPAALHRSADKPYKSLAVCFGLPHVEALSLIAEERCARLDLLAELLEVPRAEARRLRNVCVGLGLLNEERFFYKERYPWLWMTAAGCCAVGTSGTAWRPSPGSLPYREGALSTRISLVDGGPQPCPFLWRTRLKLTALSSKVAAGLARTVGYEIEVARRKQVVANFLGERNLRWIPSREVYRKHSGDWPVLPDALILGASITAIVVVPYRRDVADFENKIRQLAPHVTEICCWCPPSERERLAKAVRDLALHGLRGVHFLDTCTGAMYWQAGPDYEGSDQLKPLYLGARPRWQ